MLRDESGRFTLESTLLLPILIIVTLSCLFVSISAARQAGLLAEAAGAASRASFVWNNSSKNPLTGSFYPVNYDELYWRMFADGNNSALAMKKLSGVLALLPGSVFSEMQYSNSLLRRTISVRLASRFLVPPVVSRLYGARDLEGYAHSMVSEPAEWIRQVELIRNYWPLISSSLSMEEAETIIEDFHNRPGLAQKEQLVFHSHNESRAYLQKMVRGKQSTRATEKVGEWRLIDALDSNGIAHQAYFAYKTLDSDMEEQLLKDAEIMGNGLVNGVVWHFFRRGRDGSVGLSDALRRQLEARGIVVVVHE